MTPTNFYKVTYFIETGKVTDTGQRVRYVASEDLLDAVTKLKAHFDDIAYIDSVQYFGTALV